MLKTFKVSLLGLVCLFLVACVLDEEKVSQQLEKEMTRIIEESGSGFSPYINNISFEFGDENEDKDYRYTMVIDTNESFLEMKKTEQYEMISKFLNYSDNSTQCDNEICYLMGVTLQFNQDKYYMGYNEHKLVINDEAFNYDDLIEPEEPVKTEPKEQIEVKPKEQIETEPEEPVEVELVDDLSWHVFLFMNTKYDEITNNGESYNPSVHDEMVAELAAEEFGITAEEAGNMYESVDTGESQPYR